MPELPEVENVCRNLSEMIPPLAKIKSWKFFRSDLRFKIPKSALNGLAGKPLLSIKRRAKYILFQFEGNVMISHLGMTGAWRQVEAGWKKEKHDHLAFLLEDGKVFVYTDPRRFGFVEVVETKRLAERFADLGAEPLDAETDFSALTKLFAGIKAPVKTALMNQKWVVGVGNIYASEILFAAGVSPFRSCSKPSTKPVSRAFRSSAKPSMTRAA